MVKTNGEVKEDYVVLEHVQAHSLKRTLRLYPQNEWELMNILYSENAEYIMIFRRRFDNEFKA